MIIKILQVSRFKLRGEEGVDEDYHKQHVEYLMLHIDNNANKLHTI